MVTTRTAYDPTLFQGAAWYYARYRSKYPQALFDLLADIFKLDGKGRLLDLGCGAGLVGIHERDRFAEVVGLDQICRHAKSCPRASSSRGSHQNDHCLTSCTSCNNAIFVGWALPTIDRSGLFLRWWAVSTLPLLRIVQHIRHGTTVHRG